MLQAANALISAHGYDAIGMDHYARRGDSLAIAARSGQLHRNFMGYTTHRDQQLFGLGMSAISELDERYVQQKSKLSHWWTAVETGARVIEKGAVLTAADKLRRDVIYAIMCNFELSAAEMSARHGVDFWAHFADDRAGLEGLAAEGLVELDAAGVKVPPHARLLVRNVAMCFDPSLRAPQAGGPRFSSTV